MPHGVLWHPALVAMGSLGGNGDEGKVCRFAGFGEREEHHHEGEGTLGFEITVIDPEPIPAVRNCHTGVGRLLL